MSETGETLKDASDSYSAYTDYNKTLRTWLVTFGLGGPALFLVNARLSAALSSYDRLSTVIFCFLLGSGLQVINAFINKICNWYEYAALVRPHDNKPNRFVTWVTHSFIVDIVLDVATFILFSVAVVDIVRTFT